MLRYKIFTVIITILSVITLFSACRDRTGSGKPFTIALDGKFSTLDPIGSTTVTANDERLRTLLFNSLVKKNDKFEYIGELAKEINTSEDGATITFILQDNIKFHDGKVLTSKDVKYTFDKLFSSNGAKASAFYDTAEVPTVGAKPANSNTLGNTVPTTEKKAHIIGIETPDDKTIRIKLARPALKNQLLSNLVPVAIVPEGSEVGTQASNTKPPLGTGPYKFVSFDSVQNIVELEKFNDYFEGSPEIEKIQIKALPDANSLQAELKSQIVDIAPGVVNLAPDTFKNLEQDPNLQIQKFNGSNIQYIGFNTEQAPLNNVKVRQAIAYAINREKIINDLLLGQATIAHSILPEESWAFNAGTKYDFNPDKAKQLLDEAGFKDTNGDGKREMPKISFKVSSGNQAVSQYTQLIVTQLSEVGIPVEIDSLEFQTMLSQLQKGQYQMTTGRWVGGNQDPIFLRDLFASSEIPSESRASRNRSRYANKEVDELLSQAVNEIDREKAKQLYTKAQDIISNEVPMIPLWYPANMVVANKRVENIKVNASGDWGFVRNLTLK
ncbi:MAG: ABC transporter substrate-binding protein [Pyrinomonadaceae bacterium]